jgi:nucleoside-diphosphate-sugar epimerase
LPSDASVHHRGRGIHPGAARYLLRTGTYPIAKVRRVLGWEPRVRFPDGLARTVAWLSEQGYGPPASKQARRASIASS